MNRKAACYIFVIALILTFLVAGCAPSTLSAATVTPEPALRISGSGTALPIVQKFADAYSQRHPSARFEFDPGTNTGGAIRGVLQGTLELAVGNRALSESEAKEPLEYRSFARDAVVFTVKLPNSIRGLSTAQIQDIYGGKLTDWSELDAAAGPIVVLDRDEDESARKLVLLPLMNGRPVQARTIVLTKARDMIQTLESMPRSLGYSSAGLLQIMQPKDIQVLALDGVVPNPESVSQNVYPWQLTYGLIYHRDAPPTVRRFVDFVMGKDGRQVMEKYGYVAIK